MRFGFWKQINLMISFTTSPKRILQDSGIWNWTDLNLIINKYYLQYLNHKNHKSHFCCQPVTVYLHLMNSLIFQVPSGMFPESLLSFPSRLMINSFSSVRITSDCPNIIALSWIIFMFYPFIQVSSSRQNNRFSLITKVR